MLVEESSRTVPPRDGVLLLVYGDEDHFAHYAPTTDLPAPEKRVTAPETVFAHVARTTAPFAQVKIAYANTTRSTRVVDLYVNGATMTRVALPPTCSAAGAVWIQAALDQAGDGDELNFAVASTPELRIEGIDVH